MFDVIERLKSEWTDKYVVVDSPAPELARFAAATGIVKTVNMNGRCLVQFDQYNNTGWYDIDPSCLKVVPKPLPKPPESKPKPKAPAAATPSAASKPSAKPAASGKPSTADILAAARGKASIPAKPEASKLSTADILAAARGKKAAEATAAAPPAEAEAPPAEQEAPPASESVAAPAKAAATGPLPTTTAEKVAWCRTHDAKA